MIRSVKITGSAFPRSSPFLFKKESTVTHLFCSLVAKLRLFLFVFRRLRAPMAELNPPVPRRRSLKAFCYYLSLSLLLLSLKVDTFPLRSDVVADSVHKQLFFVCGCLLLSPLVTSSVPERALKQYSSRFCCDRSHYLSSLPLSPFITHPLLALSFRL